MKGKSKMLARVHCCCRNRKSAKALILLAVFCLSVFAVSWAGSDGPKLPKAPPESEKDTLSSAEPQEDSLSYFDSLLVIHFHPTVQCSCCINVGIFSKRSLEEYYAKPYKDGSIVFKEYDIDEDTLTAKKYQIFWSALGFEKFHKGKTEFKEIESVWEFCEKEKKFLPAFKNELDGFIRGTRDDEPKSKSESKEGK
ncbi:MAG: nitrophenyl compound nitroreductase subunit ArsF family protein [Candidatus Zixiibacteriota bacterium]